MKHFFGRDTRHETHPVYGKVRLLRRSVKDRAGRSFEWWEYDPTFKPRLPAEALRGDPSKQVFCSLHHVPKYFYVDEEQECVQCQESFVFEASEQRFWYETLKFNFTSVAIRCRKCRKRQRTERALHKQIAMAKHALVDDPDDPAVHLSIAEALVRYHSRTGRGRLAEAIAEARKARSLWPDSVEAWL